MFRSTVFEGQDHFLQAPAIYPRSSDPVKTDFPALAIGTCPFHNGIPAGLPAATPAIISPGASQKSIPAILAQVVIGVTDALATIGAYSGPKELVEALTDKITGFFDKKIGLLGS